MISWIHRKCQQTLENTRLEFRKVIWRLKDEIKSKNDIIDQLQTQLQRFEFLINQRLQKESKISVDTTHKGVKVIVKEVVNKLGYEIEIFDVGTDHYNKSRELVLWANINEKTLFITDIQNKQGSHRGHGTLALKYLNDFALIKKKSAIEGKISLVDHDHLDYLKEFYAKQAFEIITDHEGKPVRIFKEI